MAPTAKLFMHGSRQAVCLPDEFRLPGTEVKIDKVGDKVILEPLEPLERAPFDSKAWREGLRALGAADFLPEGAPEDPALGPGDDISFA